MPKSSNGAFDAEATAPSALETAMLNYIEHRNKNPKPFVWTADADLILGKVQRLCERISNSNTPVTVGQVVGVAAENESDL